MEVILSKQSIKFCDKLGKCKSARQIAIKIMELQKEFILSNDKRLKRNLSDYRRVAVGEFRVVYHIDGGQLFIDLIGKRNDSEIYKLMNNKLNC